MVSKMPNGVYEIEFLSATDEEFNGKHPAIIIPTLYEPKMYFVVPLTTYTKERWEHKRKYGCCRIESINSIARIDKLQIVHERSIKKRWLKMYRLLLPTPAELERIHAKIQEQTKLSCEKSMRFYQKYYTSVQLFRSACAELFSGNLEKSGFVTVDKEKYVYSYPKTTINKLKIEDIRDIMNAFVDKPAYQISTTDTSFIFEFSQSIC